MVQSAEIQKEKNRVASKAWYHRLSLEEKKARTVARAEYQRKYRELNPDRIAASNAKRQLEKRDEIREYQRARYKKNADTLKARAKAAYSVNQKVIAERAAKWNKENKDRRAEICRKSSKLNPETGRMGCANRRARIKASGGKITGKQVRELHVTQKGKCAGCRKTLGQQFELDHVMPLSLGGAHSIENAQLLCMPCNRKKGAMPDTAWAASLGRLFA